MAQVITCFYRQNAADVVRVILTSQELVDAEFSTPCFARLQMADSSLDDFFAKKDKSKKGKKKPTTNEDLVKQLEDPAKQAEKPKKEKEKVSNPATTGVNIKIIDQVSTGCCQDSDYLWTLFRMIMIGKMLTTRRITLA